MNPRNHPNAYVGLSVGTVASFLVTEAKLRLGVDISIQEATMIVSGVIALALFGARKVGGTRSKS